MAKSWAYSLSSTLLTSSIVFIIILYSEVTKEHIKKEFLVFHLHNLVNLNNRIRIDIYYLLYEHLKDSLPLNLTSVIDIPSWYINLQELAAVLYRRLLYDPHNFFGADRRLEIRN